MCECAFLLLPDTAHETLDAYSIRIIRSANLRIRELCVRGPLREVAQVVEASGALGKNESIWEGMATAEQPVGYRAVEGIPRVPC